MHIKPIKRTKGVVYRVYVHKMGRLISRTFERKVDALSWGQTQEASPHSLNLEITFQELADLWFRNHCEIKKSPASIRSDKTMYKVIQLHLDHGKISEITGHHIENFIAALKKEKRRSNATINKYVLLVQTIFNYAVRNDRLTKNPVRRHHFLPEDEVGYQYLTQVEAEQFISHTKRKYQGHNGFIPLLYLVALNTGMRWGELLALKWDAIYFGQSVDQAMITVKRSYCNASKQIRETTKSHKVRYVGMNTVLYRALKEAYERRDPKTDLVFHTKIGSPLRVANFNRRYFWRDVEEAHVSKIRFHDLRHTYASHFMMNGGNIYDLQKILGHSDVQTTMRYVHLAKEHILSKAALVVLGKQDNVISVDFAAQKTASS